MENPFASTETFRSAFTAGLSELLRHDTLGVYILAQANASFDPSIHALLEAPLRERFDRLQRRYQKALREGRRLTDPLDDQTVFLKLMAIGIEDIRATEFRRAGVWEIQFNQVRSFRPPRMSGEKVNTIYNPFDPKEFHFNKPFLKKEIFWSGTLNDRNVSMLYNKFPFAELHCLLVPEPRSRKPQFLEQMDHGYIWDLTQQLGETIPGVGFGFNSYGGHASVNHLHFQMFVRDSQLPVSSPIWRHNGGKRQYPMTCRRLDTTTEAWQFLDLLHEDEISYNLIYLPGRLYCLPRKKQGNYPQSPWTTGLAWHELAGCITTFNCTDYAELKSAQISKELAGMEVESLPDIPTL